MLLAGRLASLSRRDALTAVGLGLTAGWLLLLALFWLLAPDGDGGAGGLSRLFSVIGAVLPLVLIWMAVSLARAIAELRAEADHLQRQLADLREARAARAPRTSSDAPQRPASASAATRPPAPARTATAAPTTSGAVPRAQPTPARTEPKAEARPDPRQAALSLDSPEPVDLPIETVISALNFPDGPEDAPAIAALRRALTDHETARVLRAAQDVITLLADRDVYMDELPPAPIPPEVWRRFAEGTRGNAVAALAGIEEPTALALTTATLRSDEIFRDSAHHFLRHFDVLIARLIPQMDDAQLQAMSDTRSTRAFMLIGQAAGIFA